MQSCSPLKYKDHILVFSLWSQKHTDVRSVYDSYSDYSINSWEIAKLLLDSRWGHFIVRERQSCTDVLFMAVNSGLMLILAKRILIPTSFSFSSL